jgi:hypothetical protein
MIFISWGVIFCLVILAVHIGSNDLKNLSKEVKKALRLPAQETGSDDEEGMFENVKTYNKIGKRQTFIGMISVGWLLCMYNFKPFHDYWGMVALFIVNGLIIASLLGFTAEGLFMWNSSQIESSMEDGEINEN